MSVHNLMNETFREGDVYVGRAMPRLNRHIDQQGGYFGNPHRIPRGTLYAQEEDERQRVVAAFERDARKRLETDPVLRERVRALHGKRLFCWCAPRVCHGDVLDRIASELAGAEAMDGERG